MWSISRWIPPFKKNELRMKENCLPQMFQLDAWFHVPGCNVAVAAWSSRPWLYAPISCLYGGDGRFCLKRVWYSSRKGRRFSHAEAKRTQRWVLFMKAGLPCFEKSFPGDVGALAWGNFFNASWREEKNCSHTEKPRFNPLHWGFVPWLYQLSLHSQRLCFMG